MENENQIETQNDEIETVTETTVTAKPAKEPKGPPAWQLLMEAHRAKLQALGLVEEEQKNFVQIAHAETGHRIYVAKETRKVTHIPTTMPAEFGPEFSGSNGKIASEVLPENLDAALEALASGVYGKVRASKRQAKASATPPAADAVPETMMDSEEETAEQLSAE